VGEGGEPDIDPGEGDSNDDAVGLGYIVLGVIAFIIIFLVLLWLYLGSARKQALKQVKLSDNDIAIEKPTTITTLRRPARPDFAKTRTQKRDEIVRQARVERLTSHQKTVKKDILREKLASERRKVDDDMKKELEEMGIDL
jgi:hypothetical protein